MLSLFQFAHEALTYRRAALDREGAELTESERLELKDIDDALGRLESGSYGSCEQCGRAIGRLRLRAVPEARHCMDCE